MVTIHGTKWEIDTSDWKNERRDAEKCAALIFEKVSALPAQTVRQAHAAYLAAAAAADDETFDHFLNSYGEKFRADYDQVEDACYSAKKEIMESWIGVPSSGYNASIAPVRG